MTTPGNGRVHGERPYTVVVLHGGPGAPGEVRPIAEALAGRWGVLEPFQTARSVWGQVEELRQVIEEAATPPVSIVGWSWGAWLGCLLASEHPALVRRLILVSSGPFRQSHAEEIMPARLSRLAPAERERLEALFRALGEVEATESVMAEFGALMDKADACDPIPGEGVSSAFQPDVYAAVWPEADAMRRSGELLERVRGIACPVVAIHGDHDPHPARGVEEPLSGVLADFRFVLLRECGHTPWLERRAKDVFFETLRAELNR